MTEVPQHLLDRSRAARERHGEPSPYFIPELEDWGDEITLPARAQIDKLNRETNELRAALSARFQALRTAEDELAKAESKKVVEYLGHLSKLRVEAMLEKQQVLSRDEDTSAIDERIAKLDEKIDETIREKSIPYTESIEPETEHSDADIFLESPRGGSTE